MVRLEILRRKIFRILLRDWKLKSDLYTLLCYVMLFIYCLSITIKTYQIVYLYYIIIKNKINKNKNIIISYG